MITPQLLAHYQKTRDACHYRLTGHPPMTMVEQLATISEQARQYDSQDCYGQGELIESFETEIATLLGKEAAVFLPSGTMAQCIALRVWADLAGCRSVGFHATSHLELHEHNAYETLYGLNSVLLGAPDRVVTLADLESVDSKLAAVLLELPMREIGGQLPNWQQLSAQSQWARERGIALHMDGARLWQCPAYYGRDMAEIAALFDSVYVSFYKDIGGIAGSVLAGSADFIASARTWIRRAGGNLYALYPYVLSARAGMERNLAAMPECIRSASWLAAYLNQFESVATLPLQPPTNLFHLRIPCDPARLVEYACDWSERHKVFLLPLPRAYSNGHSIMEFSMGQAVQAHSPAQWESWLQDFFTHLPRDSN